MIFTCQHGFSTSLSLLVLTVALILTTGLNPSLASATEVFRMRLNNFHSWNLPFSYYPKVTQSVFAGKPKYEMAVDMNSYFSVIFTTTNITADSTIDYSYITGTTYTLSGKWDQATFEFTGYDADNNTVTHSLTITCFFVANESPIHGLYGTLGFAPTVYDSNYNDYSLLYQLSVAVSGGGGGILSMLFDSGYYLPNRPELPYKNDMRFFSDDSYGDGEYNLKTGSQLTVEDLIEPSDSSSSVSSAFGAGTPPDNVNPFLLYELTELKVYEWYVNNMRLVNNRTNYGKPMYMTSSLNGMLVQQEFYDEMYDTFFNYLCNATSLDLALPGFTNFEQDCYCDGFGFGGMPSLYLDTNENSTNVFQAGRSQSYELLPQDYLYFPKVDIESRSTKCRLGMENTGFISADYRDTQESLQQVILGKVFIRKFKMGLSFNWDNSTTSIMVVNPSENSSFVTDLILNTCFLLMLCLFIVCMTRMRIARFTYEQDMFVKLKILAEEDPKITLQVAKFHTNKKDILALAKDADAQQREQINAASDKLTIDEAKQTADVFSGKYKVAQAEAEEDLDNGADAQ